jgi:lysophospholipid acyltransferase (LPLAT)-like uncharacterized protein
MSKMSEFPGGGGLMLLGGEVKKKVQEKSWDVVFQSRSWDKVEINIDGSKPVLSPTHPSFLTRSACHRSPSMKE